MPATFEGNTVTVLRPATVEEPGFKQGVGECVLIRMSDGTEKIVAKSDLKDSDTVDSDVGESVLGFPFPSEERAATKHKATASPHRKR